MAGLSPELNSMEQILRIRRPTDVPQQGLLCDLLWSDPEKDLIGWDKNNERGVSHIFGTDIVDKFCRKHKLDLVCRAHEVNAVTMRTSFSLVVFFENQESCVLVSCGLLTLVIFFISYI